jgi:hypothetical protein
MSLSQRISIVSLSVLASIIGSLFFITNIAFAAPSFDGDGAGTLVNPYQITNCQQLQSMQNNLGDHYALKNDIDCSETIGWNILLDAVEWDADTNYTMVPQGGISRVTYNGNTYYALQNSGPDSVVVLPNGDPNVNSNEYWAITQLPAGHAFGFTPVGELDNQFTGSLTSLGEAEYVISGLYINRPDVGDYVGTGLFAALRGATVSDISITQADITGELFTGILAGIIGGFFDGGKFLDLQDRSIIDNVHTSGVVYGSQNVGGLAGFVFATTITNSSSSAVVDIFEGGDVVRKATRFFGGLVGFVTTQSILDGVSASGDVAGGQNVGGLIGGLGILNIDEFNQPNQQDYPIVINSSASGDVQAGTIGGGLVGLLAYASVDQSSASGNVYQQDENGDFARGFFGGLIGVVQDAVILESYASGNVQGFYAGGFLGAALQIGSNNPVGANVSVSQSFSTGSVVGAMYSGGFAGAFLGGEITNSYSTSNVFVGSVEVNETVLPGGFSGGFIGVMAGDVVLVDVYSAGSIEGEIAIGGFIGIIGALPIEGPEPTPLPTNATIQNAYSLGQVTAPQDAEYVGGFIGAASDDEVVAIEIISSYWNTETSGRSVSAGGVGRTTAQMKNITTYTRWDIQSSTNQDLQYPTLSWQLGQNNPVWLIYQAPVRRSSGGGSSVFSVVSNLQQMGKQEQAQEIKDQFSHLFAEEVSSVSDLPQSSSEILNSGACPAHLIVTNNMRRGDRDGQFSAYNNGVVTQVALLQSHINRILSAQYDQAAGPVDGIYGSLTAQGVRRLQTALNEILKPTPLLAIDGIVGPFTRSAINNSCGDIEKSE